jgi:sugar transferase (PEP-CTERM system associated)
MVIRIFRHYVPTQLLILAFSEALLFFGSVYLAVGVRFGLDVDLSAMTGEHLSVSLRAFLYAAIMIGTVTAFGMYRADNREDDAAYWVRYVGAFGLGAVVLVVFFYLVPQTFLGRGVMALAFLFSIASSALARHAVFRLLGTSVFKRRVLVLGSGALAAEVEALRRRLGEHARFVLVGFVSLDREQSVVADVKLITQRCPMLASAHRHRADEILVGVRDRRGGKVAMQELLECKLEGVNVVDLSTFYERETGEVQLSCINASWIVYSEGFRRNAARDVVKRVFDVGVSSFLLGVMTPVMFLTAAAVWLESGGPILYRQRRVGECGHPFDILKFRSMRQDAEKDGVARWAEKNDTRVTRVGRFIRLTRIDELPQIFNVLRGDMSFVGPRPERPQFVRDLARQIPYYLSRHTVKPGITGWAQIRHHYGASVEDAIKKLQCDLYYAKNHTLFLDLIILFQTVQVVLFGRGAR